jgi:SAM-dependent methyltransferase
MANDAMALALGARDHAVLIDVGIGTGRQFAALLGELATSDSLPQRLTVVGIEPAAEALDQARSALQALALALGIELRFHGFASSAEDLSDADWQQIQSLCSTRPVINAAFALHHIADDAQGGEQRRSVLRRLRALDPMCLVLSEPDVDHVEPRFLQRFRNCFAHFSAVFALLDLLQLEQADIDALKVGFFGREIADILGADEHRRSERHEPAAAWFQHLASTGFVVQAPVAVLPPSTHPAVSVALSGPRAVIRAIDEPVVSVFVAVPRPVVVNNAAGFDAFAMAASAI